jgi:chromosome segregation ATPase
MHLAWEAAKEVKDVRVQSKQFENEIERLKRRLNHKEAVEIALMNRINQLEEELDYWKTAYDGVYVN